MYTQSPTIKNISGQITSIWKKPNQPKNGGKPYYNLKFLASDNGQNVEGSVYVNEGAPQQDYFMSLDKGQTIPLEVYAKQNGQGYGYRLVVPPGFTPSAAPIQNGSMPSYSPSAAVGNAVGDRLSQLILDPADLVLAHQAIEQSVGLQIKVISEIVRNIADLSGEVLSGDEINRRIAEYLGLISGNPDSLNAFISTAYISVVDVIKPKKNY